MSNELNSSTVLVSAGSAALAAAPAFTYGFDAEVTDKRLEGVKAADFSRYAMREIVKGLRATEKGNRSNVILHVCQVVETVARTMRDGRDTGKDTMGTTKDGKPFPTGVENALKNAFREVIVAMIKSGDAPYLNCGTSIARIKAMPKATPQQRKLWDYQARKLADSTLFMNGQAVEKPKGKYLPEALRDAKSKELVESLKVLRNYTNKCVAFLWTHHNDLFAEYAFRDDKETPFRGMEEGDVEAIGGIIAEKAGGTMSELAAAFAKPRSTGEEKSQVEKLLESFVKLNLEDRTAFLAAAQTKHGELVRAAENAAASVNSGDTGTDDGDDWADLRDAA